MVHSLRDKIWWFAVCSRVLVLTISSVSNFILPDHEADAFIAPMPTNHVEETYGDVVVRYILGGLARWDAQYFMHIARYGYTYEPCLAFFPLFPLLARVFSYIIFVLCGGILHDFSVILISSISLNVLFFVKSVLVLYDLSLEILQNKKIAYVTSILYCLNPASIFFSAPYSESLYAYVTFYGMLKCGCGFVSNLSISCGVLFGLSALTRSNGILNIGFIAYKFVHEFAHQTLPSILQEILQLEIKILWMMPVICAMVVLIALPYLISIVLSLSPFLLFQIFGYQMYCIPNNHTFPEFLVTYAEANNLKLPGSLEEHNLNQNWCHMTLPFSYSYIQSHYWNVGFLQYYQWKQIPNFILAIPVVYIILSESYTYILKYTNHSLYLGLNSSLKIDMSFNQVSFCSENQNILTKDIFPYVIHALFLTIFSVLCAHVQVTTRLICSSSPLLYWFCAKIILEDAKTNTKSTSKLCNHLKNINSKTFKKKDFVDSDIESMENMSSRWKVFVFCIIPTKNKAKFVYFYLLTYMVLGTILFSNFLPWT